MKQQHHHFRQTLFLGLLWFSAMTTGLAQGTAFTYQGKLVENGNLANGTYDLQFKLFDTATVGTGNQQGSTVVVPNVTVTNGSFAVPLDFGACASCFNGAERFLEIAVKTTGGGTFTTLSPRQAVTSTPYAIKSANATTATTADGLSAAGSANFIQNGTSQQAATNFNIGGNGTAGGTLTGSIVNAVQQVSINGLRAFTVNGAYNDGSIIFTATNTFTGDGAGGNTTPSGTLSNPNGKFNSFYGAGAGRANTTGLQNTFFGAQAGFWNTTGFQNAFFGDQAGRANTTGGGNAFFGSLAGVSNTTGVYNAFFGYNAGFSNTTGQFNAFFGMQAGRANTTGQENAFFGASAGANNTTGGGNAFFGSQAGLQNNGGGNAFVGYAAGKANTTGSNNAFFGNQAGRNNDTGINNAFFGSVAGFSNTTGQDNAFFGTSAGQSNTTGGSNAFFGSLAGQANTIGTSNAFFGTGAGINNTTGGSNTFIGRGADFNTINPTGDNNTLLGASTLINSGISNATAIGAFASVTQSNSLVLGAINGINGATANTNVGIGTTAPLVNLHVRGPAPRFRLEVNNSNDYTSIDYVTPSLYWATGVGGSNVGTLANKFYVYEGATGQVRLVVAPGGNVGIGNASPVYTLDVAGTGYMDFAVIGNLVGGGGSTLCRNASGFVSTCSSSLRYKTAVQSFTSGLAIINRLRPISFTWKQDGSRDLGLAAEEVEKVEPLLTFRNHKGEVEGVKYSQLSALFINAFKEQQTLITNQQQQIDQQQSQLAQQQKQINALNQQVEARKNLQQEFAALKHLLCASHPKAALCKGIRH